MKRLMLTNEAVARGAYEAGVKVVSSKVLPSLSLLYFMISFKF
jgi:TPP-dependent indolepyruvate ferredoxin oxidoreductase alpha subunit